VYYQADTRFVIAVDVPFNFLDDELPPSFDKSTDLLIEFCTLYNFGSLVADGVKSFEPLQQHTAAFLAALALPFYNHLHLQPQLPMPRITADHSMHAIPPEFIQDYSNDLPYFMTLSIHPAFVCSAIWSRSNSVGRPVKIGSVCSASLVCPVPELMP
jgi:hypothetical protein